MASLAKCIHPETSTRHDKNIQSEILKFSDICVSCSSPKTDLLTNFLNPENRSFENISIGSSLIYNTSARQERHECDTSDTGDTRATQVRYECYTNDTSATTVKNLILIATSSKNIFLHPSIYYMAIDIPLRNNFS